jgi:hypothetical protein
MARSFRQRLQIRVAPTYVTVNGEELMNHIDKKFYTKTGLLVASGYNRVVIGKRGPYVEFHWGHIKWNDFYVPDDKKYRADSKVVFYEEWRSMDKAFVKLYLQKKTVAYADYRIGKCYISPFDLYLSGKRPVII